MFQPLLDSRDHLFDPVNPTDLADQSDSASPGALDNPARWSPGEPAASVQMI